MATKKARNHHLSFLPSVAFIHRVGDIMRTKLIEDATNKIEQQVAILKSVGLVQDAIEFERMTRSIFDRLQQARFSNPLDIANRDERIVKQMGGSNE
jgi:hypothetical protein